MSAHVGVRVVFFDLGGVLCRFVPARRLTALAAASGLGPDEVSARIWRSGLDRDLDLGRLHPGDAAGASPFAAAHGAICRALGVSIAPDDLCQRWALAWEPDPAMLAIVDRVRSRCRTAVLTDNGPVLLEAMPRVFPELTRRFDWLVFSCELGATKPGPAAFERALARVGCSPPEALLVDDLPANVDGARAAGLHAHRYTTLGRLVQALAEAGVLETGTTLPTG